MIRIYCTVLTSHPQPKTTHHIKMSADNTNQSILILGGGCFGLATAFELAQKGYKNVTILEKDVDVPSRFSAAYDLNKVIRAEYADDFYTQLALVGTF